MLGSLILRNSTTLRTSKNLLLTSLRASGNKQIQRKLHGSKDIQSLIQKPRRIRITASHRVAALIAIGASSALMYGTWMYDDWLNETFNPPVYLCVPTVAIVPFIITWGLRVLFGSFIVGVSAI